MNSDIFPSFAPIMKLVLQPRISSLAEAEHHVYSIPSAGTLASRAWTSLTHDRRVSLRSKAIDLWRIYLEEGRRIHHPQIIVPEYRQMLAHPDGELIVEEI